MGLRDRLRRARPPEEAVRGLEHGERVVAWAAVAGGGAAVATQRGLWLPVAGGMRRVPWHQVDKATWGGGELTITEAYEVEPGVIEDGPPVTLVLDDPRDLPPVVRARVTQSVGYSVHHPVPGGGVRVVGRRVSGQDGLSWVVRYDEGTDRHHPGVVAMTEQLLAQARATAGVPE